VRITDHKALRYVHFCAPLRPNTFLSTLLSNTLSLCSSLKLKDQVSHSSRLPYKWKLRTEIALLEITDIRAMTSKWTVVATQGGGIYHRGSKNRLRAAADAKRRNRQLSQLFGDWHFRAGLPTPALSQTTNHSTKNQLHGMHLPAKTEVSLMCSQINLLKAIAHRTVH